MDSLQCFCFFAGKVKSKGNRGLAYVGGRKGHLLQSIGARKGPFEGEKGLLKEMESRGLVRERNLLRLGERRCRVWRLWWSLLRGKEEPFQIKVFKVDSKCGKCGGAF